MTSCVEENFKGNLTIVDGEVSFTASLRKPHMTKTSYGDIGTDNKQEVFWVHGDEITVYGADCNISQANYAVSVANPDSEGNLVVNKEQNYATELNKTTTYGVQWGNVVKTDYYAVYPSTGNKFVAAGVTTNEPTTAEGNKAVEVTTKSATVTARIDTIQNVDFKLYDTGQKDPLTNKNILGWKGVHYASDIHNPTSAAALMYACTRGAEAADKNGNPKTVDLQFQPFSTVLRFSFDGFVVKDENNVNVDYNSAVYVNEIVLEAPYKVAGDFNLTINNDAVYDESGKITKSPTATAGEGKSNKISIVPSVRIPLETHQKVEFDVFTIPQTYTMSATQLWQVTLKTTGGDKTYKLIPKIIENNIVTPTTATLKAGQIHNLTIPALSIKRPEIQIPDSSWIEYIPRNVYLSELSMPGAWYCTNPDYQGASTLRSLYHAGVRAFNIDCRMTATADSWSGNSWSGGYQLKDNPNYVLQCAGSETLEGINILGGTRVSEVKDGYTVESQLSELAGYVEDDEFIIVVLTIAEQPKSLRGALSGNVQAFGNNVNPTNVLNAIKEILENKGKEFKVFGYRDKDQGKVINANTTINDVLGSMLIKINVNINQTDTENTSQQIVDLSTFNMKNVLLSEGSMASENRYTDSVIPLGKFNSMNKAPLYWGSAKISEPEMLYYYHHAQLTTSDSLKTSGSSTPSIFDRKSAINNIVDKSYEIYKQEKHDAIFQIGIGGRFDNDDRTILAKSLNNYVLNIVNEKLVTEPSPIGMVLMNYAETTGAKLVKSILEMNKKFFLNRNPEQPEWPDGNDPFNPNTVNLPQESAAYVSVSSEDAF